VMDKNREINVLPPAIFNLLTAQELENAKK